MSDRETIRILVVDDEEGLRMTLAANLELEGFEVVEAANAEEALRRAKDGRVDLVLTDIRMPGLSGVDLFRRLKQELPGIPVVLMTAFALESDVEDALAEGAFTVLAKPFDVARAVATLFRASARPNVLVIDDATQDAESTAEALRTVGVRAQVVSDGPTALEAVARGGIDVCVLDLVMPGMNGVEVAESLREQRRPVAIIATSGYSVPEMMHRLAESGAVTCLRKPFNPRELVKVIGRARALPLEPA